MVKVKKVLIPFNNFPLWFPKFKIIICITNTSAYDLKTMRLFENVLNSDSTNRSRLQSINSYLQTFSLKHQVDTEISTKQATNKNGSRKWQTSSEG